VLIFNRHMHPMMRNVANRLKEDDERRQCLMYKMVQDEIRAEIEKKALRDAELKRMEYIELMRYHDAETERNNKAGRMAAFRRYP
jgi:hypothetical protein